MFLRNLDKQLLQDSLQSFYLCHCGSVCADLSAYLSRLCPSICRAALFLSGPVCQITAILHPAGFPLKTLPDFAGWMSLRMFSRCMIHAVRRWRRWSKDSQEDQGSLGGTDQVDVRRSGSGHCPAYPRSSVPPSMPMGLPMPPLKLQPPRIAPAKAIMTRPEPMLFGARSVCCDQSATARGDRQA